MLEKLRDSIDHFEIAIDESECKKAISEFHEGYLDESSTRYHNLKIPLYLDVAGRRKSVLHAAQFSDDLLAVDFWFFGSEGDAPEWGQSGIKDTQLKDFQDFLVELFMIFNFPVGILEFESSITSIFDTDEGWPHDSYNLGNINSRLINEQMMSIVRNGFIDPIELNIAHTIEGGQIIMKK